MSSIAIATGSIHSGDRLLNYTIREYVGMCLSLHIYVVATQQSWSLFLPIIETVGPLRRLWTDQEVAAGRATVGFYDSIMEARHNDRIGKWILSCTTLEFDGGLISAAHFDHDGFKNRFNAEVLTVFQKAAGKLLTQYGSPVSGGPVTYPRLDREGDDDGPRGRKPKAGSGSPKRRKVKQAGAGRSGSSSASPNRNSASRSPSPGQRNLEQRPPFGHYAFPAGPRQSPPPQEPLPHPKPKVKIKTKGKNKRSKVPSPQSDLRFSDADFDYRPSPARYLSSQQQQQQQHQQHLATTHHQYQLGSRLETQSVESLQLSSQVTVPHLSTPSLLVAPQQHSVSPEASTSGPGLDHVAGMQSFSQELPELRPSLSPQMLASGSPNGRSASTGSLPAYSSPSHGSALRESQQQQQQFEAPPQQEPSLSQDSDMITFKTELQGLQAQVEKLKERAGTQRVQLGEALRGTRSTPSAEDIDAEVDEAERRRLERASAFGFDNMSARHASSGKDPFAALTAAATAAAVAASEAILASRMPDQSPRSGSEMATSDVLPTRSQIKQDMQRALAAESKNVAQELLIQALQEELETKARMSQQQLQELQADLQATKEKEMLELKKAADLQLKRVQWEKEQLLLERQQELNSLQLLQQLELQALNRASEREVKSLSDLIEQEERLLKEREAEAERLRREAETERLAKERVIKAAKEAQDEEVRRIEAVRARDIAHREKQLELVREQSERVLMEREQDAQLTLLAKLHADVMQSEQIEAIRQQYLPLQKQNEVLMDMVHSVMTKNALDAVDSAIDPVFEMWLFDACLEADYFEGETVGEREVRKRFEREQVEREERMAAEKVLWEQAQARMRKELEDKLLCRDNDIEGLKHLIEENTARAMRAENEKMLKDEELRRTTAQFESTSQLELVQARLRTVVELEADISVNTFSRAAIKRLRDEKSRLQAMERALLGDNAIGMPVPVDLLEARIRESQQGGDSSVSEKAASALYSAFESTGFSTKGPSMKVPLSKLKAVTEQGEADLQTAAAPTPASEKKPGASKPGWGLVKRELFTDTPSSTPAMAILSTSALAVKKMTSQQQQAPASNMSPLLNELITESVKVASAVGSSATAATTASTTTATAASLGENAQETTTESAGEAPAILRKHDLDDHVARMKLALSSRATQLQLDDPDEHRAALVRASALTRAVDTSSDPRLINMALETSVHTHALDLAKKCLLRVSLLLDEAAKKEEFFELDLQYYFKAVIICSDESAVVHGVLDTVFALISKVHPSQNLDLEAWLDVLSLAGVFEMLLVLTSHHGRDPVLCFKALKCFFKLTHTHPTNRARIGRDHIYVEFLKKMSKDHRSNPSVLDPLLRVLVNITTDCSEGVKALIQEDAAASLVRLLKIHVKNEKLSSAACRVLINISQTAEKSVQDHIASIGPTLVVALEHYKDKLKVLDLFCWLMLAAIVDNIQARHQLIDSGCLQALFNLMSAEGAKEPLIFFVIKVLVQLIDPSYLQAKDLNMAVLRHWTGLALRRGHSDLKSKAALAIDKVFGAQGLEALNKESDFEQAQKVLLTQAMQQEAAAALKTLNDAKERARQAKAAADAVIGEENLRLQQEQLLNMKTETEVHSRMVANQERKAREVAEQQLKAVQEASRREQEKVEEYRRHLEGERLRLHEEKLRLERMHNAGSNAEKVSALGVALLQPPASLSLSAGAVASSQLRFVKENDAQGTSMVGEEEALNRKELRDFQASAAAAAPALMAVPGGLTRGRGRAAMTAVPFLPISAPAPAAAAAAAAAASTTSSESPDGPAAPAAQLTRPVPALASAPGATAAERVSPNDSGSESDSGKSASTTPVPAAALALLKARRRSRGN
jgi:hypothetical protein